jgi:hypothetical protein
MIHAAKRHGAEDLAQLLAETKQQLKPLNQPTDEDSAEL